MSNTQPSAKDRITPSTRHFFLRPYGGKPSPVHLAGLFLISPHSYMKLLGMPMRQVYADMGRESLFKRMERLKPDDLPQARRLLEELLPLWPTSQLFLLIEAALAGDRAAVAHADSLGPWEAFLYEKKMAPGGKLSPLGAFLLDIEDAYKLPEQLVREGRFVQAANDLSLNKVMREFLWPQALDIFVSATRTADLLPLQVSVALEIQLSIMALVDVASASAADSPPTSQFSCLIPTTAKNGGNPTSRFFRWLTNEVGATKIDALLEKALSDTGGAANTTTLKRWSNGSHQPREALLEALAKEDFGDANHEVLWNMYQASRHLNFIGYTAETIRERALQLEPGRQHLLAPWPRLPFDCISISEWLERRYPFWLQYHRQRRID